MVLNEVPNFYLKKSIGVIAFIFGLIQVTRNTLVSRDAHWQPSYIYGTVVGIATGFFSILAHIGGVLTMMYVFPQRLPNRAFVGTATVLYFSINLIKMLPYIKLGFLNSQTLKEDLSLIPFTTAGMMLGIFLNRRISDVAFFKSNLSVCANNRS